MTFVITGGCCNDASCIPVCPVQCIRPRPGDQDFLTAEQLYIDPSVCIDCGACVDECPVDAIHGDFDVPDGLEVYVQLNADYFADTTFGEEDPPDPVRRSLPPERPELKVAIVGTGPAGCYAAGELSSIAGVSVSMFERLPSPFGLVRYGVAPDHTDTKKVSDSLWRVLARRSVNCFFNVEIGRDLSIDDLLEHHHAVIWANGASDDRQLGIPGEDLRGVHSAREFVAWYNGHPDSSTSVFDVSGSRAVVIGNGNVAMDVARILTRPSIELAQTDMADHAISRLSESSIADVVVAARRGVHHASFTTSELINLTKLDGVELIARPEEVTSTEPDPSSPVEAHKLNLLRAAKPEPTKGARSITLRFDVSPISINGTDRVESVTFAHADGSLETIEATLVLKAIGYRGQPVGGLPFDDDLGTIANKAGRVLDKSTGRHVSGHYCAGWIKRGATGVVGTNKVDAAETVEAILKDFSAGILDDPPVQSQDIAEVVANRVPGHVDKSGWLKINAAEKQAGSAAGRPRIKLVTIEDLLAAAHT